MPVKKRRGGISKTNARTPSLDAIRNRNRAGVSGLDPMDTYREYGFLEGLFLRNLFTGSLRTRNPWLLALMTGAGFYFCWPLIPMIADLGDLRRLIPIDVCVVLPVGIVGLALLFNVAINFIEQEQAK